MGSKSRNRRRRQNKKKAIQQKRKEENQTPSQVVRHQAADQKHPFNNLPDAIVKVILEYKMEFETWTVLFDKTLERLHNIHIQAKAVHGLMLMPVMAGCPPFVRDGVISGVEMLQEMSSKWLSALVETYICTKEVVDECKVLQEHIQEIKDTPHPAFAFICQLALEQHKWNSFKQTLPLDDRE
jgi:hypothetical protein